MSTRSRASLLSNGRRRLASRIAASKSASKWEDNGICVALPKVLELTSIEQRYKVAVRVAAMKCSWNPIFPVNYYTRVIMLCLTEDKNHTGGYYGYADPVLNAFYAHRFRALGNRICMLERARISATRRVLY
jgi:hypothetical protein